MDMIKNRYFAYALFIALVILFWNIFDYLFNKATYSFDAGMDISVPLVTGIIIGYTLFLRNKD